MTRKILLTTADRAETGLLEPVMTELKKKDVIVKWCRLDSRAASPLENIAHFYYVLFDFQPDIVVIPCDRNEMVYAATYAFQSGFIVCHFHAGNNSSNHPDDINRRVISCFSHIMLCNMQEHKSNLILQGEDELRIHVVGSTAFDNIAFDDSLALKEGFDLVILHPNPTSAEKTRQDLDETIKYVKSSGKPTIWISPNHDKNFEIIQNFLAEARFVIHYETVPRNMFLSLLKNCDRAVGNSSSFYYELPALCHPQKVLQIGERNRNLHVTPIRRGGSSVIAELLSTIELDEKLRNKRLAR